MWPNIVFLLKLYYSNFKKLTDELISWYTKNKRDLPWRKTSDPYKIWVSEIILQQTQMKKGIDYYVNFIKKFPNIETLAKSNDIKILNVWKGLGYYNRALNMLSAAKIVMANYNGLLPKQYKNLIKLKGVGEYTASAISSICNNEQRAVVDGNVYRVLSRIYNIEDPINSSKGKKIYSDLANRFVPKKNPGIYNQAIMDFGATHCTKYQPKCDTCMFQKKCVAFKLKIIADRPVKKSTLHKKNRFFNYLHIKDESGFIINKRRKLDIWRSLYDMPLIESYKSLTKDEILKNRKLTSFIIKDIHLNYKTEHILSHQKLQIIFWNIKVKSINNKYKKIQFGDVKKYPFPRPIEKYFKMQKNRNL